MRTVELVRFEVVDVVSRGTVAVAFVVDAEGSAAAIAVEPRMASDMQTALAHGERPIVHVESWQLLWPRP